MKIYAITTVVFLLNSLLLKGQNIDTSSIMVAARSMEDRVVVRWAPTNFFGWQWCNENGYRVVRNTISRNGIKLSQATQLSSEKNFPAPIRPAAAGEWQVIMDQDEIAGIAASALFGESLEMETPTGVEFVQMFNKSREQDIRFGFGLFAADQSLPVAEMMGLALQDQDVVAGEEYLYRVFPAATSNKVWINAGAVLVTAGEREPLPPPQNLQAKFGDHHVELSWVSSDVYTSYWVERASEEGENFHRINRSPIVYNASKRGQNELVVFKDTLTENFKTYHFRVRGKTIFGEISPLSDTVAGVGRPGRLPFSIGISSINEFPEGQLQLQWQLPDQFQDRIEGVDIYRAPSKSGDYQKINGNLVPADIYTFTDDSPLQTNYYYVVARDQYGYEYRSFAALGQIVDDTPPLPTKNLKGEIDKEGVVKLSWAPNLEDDLMGYRVFSSNQENGNYGQVTAYFVRDTTYSHRINMQTLSEKVFYKVIALDFRENYSNYSIACELNRPDVIPPAAPVIKKINPKPDGVHILWVPSPSEDVVRHVLQRKVPFEKDWKNLFATEENEGEFLFIDSTASYRYEYAYRILAIDEADLKTSTHIELVKPLDTGIRPPFEGLAGKVDRREKHIELSWYYPDEPGLLEFIVYRGVEEGSLITYKTIKRKAILTAIDPASGKQLFLFRDMQLKMDTHYRYQLLAKYRNGASSPLTDILEFDF